MNALESLKFFLPESFLLIGALVVLLANFFTLHKKALGVLSLLTLAATATLAITSSPTASQPLFFGFFLLSPFTHFFRLFALGVIAITILISFSYKPLPRQDEGEYYALFLLMAFGLILMASSTNLLMIFISIEFVSILSYLLVGFLKKDVRAKEAAVKYLLFGSVASGVMLYGMSILYGMAGSIELSEIQKAVNASTSWPIFVTAMLLVLVGLGFKISMAPFHMWAPDVYEAAPTPVTAFLTVGPKALGFALLLRVFDSMFLPLYWKWQLLLTVLSILTMTLGNVVAVAQTNIKRLLGYSSIAQAGYILMGLAVHNDTGLTGILVYLTAYALTNLGAFITVIAVSNALGNDEINSYAGLSRRSPLLAASLTLFLLSLAGIPPLAGFLGKFFVFASAIEGGFNVLAIAAALNSAVAAFYYFKVVRLMYLVPAATEEPVPSSPSLSIALGLTLAGVVLFGLFPSPLIAFVKEAILF